MCTRRKLSCCLRDSQHLTERTAAIQICSSLHRVTSCRSAHVRLWMQAQHRRLTHQTWDKRGRDMLAMCLIIAVRIYTLLSDACARSACSPR